MSVKIKEIITGLVYAWGEPVTSSLHRGSPLTGLKRVSRETPGTWEGDPLGFLSHLSLSLTPDLFLHPLFSVLFSPSWHQPAVSFFFQTSVHRQLVFFSDLSLFYFSCDDQLLEERLDRAQGADCNLPERSHI